MALLSYRSQISVQEYVRWLTPTHPDLEFILDYYNKNRPRLKLLVAVHHAGQEDDYYVADESVIKKLAKKSWIDYQTRKQALFCLKKLDSFQQFIIPAFRHFIDCSITEQIVPHWRVGNSIRTAWPGNTAVFSPSVGFTMTSAILLKHAEDIGPFRSIPDNIDKDSIDCGEPLNLLFGIKRFSSLSAT